MHLGKMGTQHGTSEIVELGEELDLESNFVKQGSNFSIEDDINRLFESIDIKTSARNLGSSQVLRDSLQKKSMKRPMRVGRAQASGIGISEPISLKQALRGLSISHASEMAALKRSSKQSRLSGASEAGTFRSLHGTVVVETNETGQLLNKGNVNLLEISLIPERFTAKLPENIPDSQHVPKLENQTAGSSSTTLVNTPAQKAKATKTVLQVETCTLPADVGHRTSEMELGRGQNLRLKLSSLSARCKKKLPVLDEIVPAPVAEIRQDKEQKPKAHSSSSCPSPKLGSKVIQSTNAAPKSMKTSFGNKNLVKKRSKLGSTSGLDNPGPSNSGMDCHTAALDLNKESSTSSCNNAGIDVCSSSVDSTARKTVLITDCCRRSKTMVTKADGSSRSREKGEFSQSSKSSVGEYSSTTSFSEESNLSGSSRVGCRPHMSKDSRWEAVRRVQKNESLGLRHFNLLKKLGGGDIGSVYLAELAGSNCLFALKVMDNEFLALRKKMTRAQTEREILQLLDHPFLPTLFLTFTTDKFSCLVMEYCPGGDLHVLRQKQPNRSFSEQAVRFYAAEVLLALEYLHMLGIVYRDLKPENILVREDGHIMLTDFDLSLRCTPNPTLLKPSSPVVERSKRVSSPCTESSCMDPFCLQPSCEVMCFNPRLLSAASRTGKLKPDLVAQVSPLPELVVEPTSARSNSFVGTHEYLAPEIIKGEGHGSAVDWWTFGILLYELLYGKTPFKGTENEDTLANAVSHGLKFPESPMVSSQARDLISRLLEKAPLKRLGSLRGAAEIKQHPFFEGLNWALIRCAIPPELPVTFDFRSLTRDTSSQNAESSKSEKESRSRRDDHLVFEMF